MNNTTILQKSGVFALACVGILALSGTYFILKQAGENDKRVFAVQGKGEVEVKANKAKITATFYQEGKTQKEASDGLNTKLEDMFKTFENLNSMKITKDDIKTDNYSVNPKYEYCDYVSARVQPCTSNPKVIGYTATMNVTFTLKENEDKVAVKDKVEKVLGIMSDVKAQNVNGPAWEVDNKAAIDEARAQAVAEAKSKAEAIARSLGLSLGKIANYSESQGGGNYPVPMMYKLEVANTRAMGAMDAASPVQVSEGTDKVIVNVDITYELR